MPLSVSVASAVDDGSPPARSSAPTAPVNKICQSNSGSLQRRKVTFTCDRKPNHHQLDLPHHVRAHVRSTEGALSDFGSAIDDSTGKLTAIPDARLNETGRRKSTGSAMKEPALTVSRYAVQSVIESAIDDDEGQALAHEHHTRPKISQSEVSKNAVSPTQAENIRDTASYVDDGVSDIVVRKEPASKHRPIPKRGVALPRYLLERPKFADYWKQFETTDDKGKQVHSKTNGGGKDAAATRARNATISSWKPPTFVIKAKDGTTSIIDSSNYRTTSDPLRPSDHLRRSASEPVIVAPTKPSINSSPHLSPISPIADDALAPSQPFSITPPGSNSQLGFDRVKTWDAPLDYRTADSLRQPSPPADNEEKGWAKASKDSAKNSNYRAPMVETMSSKGSERSMGGLADWF